jgi:mRNA interferase MazF
MLTPGDVVELDLGTPAGSEAGLYRPAIVVTAARVLNGGPNVVQVVPLTRTIRTSSAEIVVEPDGSNRLTARSSAQCQHVRSVATTRLHQRIGNVGPVVLGEVRETLALLLDL